jgi:nicotinamide-nucleotide amidase
MPEDEAGLAERAARLAEEIAERLLARGETVAIAECTAGGLIAHTLSNIPGSSRWFLGSIVPYHRRPKIEMLGVPADLLAQEGSVSAAVVEALARGVRERMGATWGLAESGTAGPQTGRRSAKPAGETYVAVVGGPTGALVVQSRHMQGPDRGRVANKWAFAVAALELLTEVLQAER